ncbi:MAG: rbfA [Dehalococcoidia bacterium]|nr:rbfA [Dehalococcoidia bacterium]
MSTRIDRINELLREEISYLLVREVNDPRLQGFVTIVEVDTSSDLKFAQVYVSVLGNEAEKQEALLGLRSAAGFLRKSLANRIKMRSIPQLTFHGDNSIERGARLLESIHNINSDS